MSSAVALSAELLDAARKLPAGRATLERLVHELRRVDPVELSQKARLAFWINLYNALLLDAFDRFGAPRFIPMSGIFEKAKWVVGGAPHSLHVMEHAMLRGNRRPPLHFKRALPTGDTRLRGAVDVVDPRIHFALNCGATSCPPIRAYTEENVDAQLDIATAAYVSQEARLDRQRSSVTLPRLMKYFAVDFGDRARQLAMTARALGGNDEKWLMERASSPSLKVKYARYDWTSAPH